ncbi:NUDIX domain-containing protein [Georgenia sp. SYP-B2076]|uniref:NUDIX domain-containing protein n=1 Tax=Georgenia sp. SYP-B2076 TaxID=2495881 RepID=UPI001F0B97DC|nr:NUDIX domain-containing protein [Georgenia sp. SYP-B2076]
MPSPARRPSRARRLPDARVHRQPGDGWVECACGNPHWGLNGAAGLLLWRSGADGPQLVLQHRALWSHHGGTWGLPGGAISDGETPVAGAVREAAEEAGVVPASMRVRATRALVHPDWAYTTVLAEATGPVTPRVSDPESIAVQWVDLASIEDYELLPAFGATLPELRTMLRRLVLVVDAANVVGSRPDGWWADRHGATLRLRDHLVRLAHEGLPAADVGLPGERWYPEIVLVTEGAGRGVAGVDGVLVVEADGSGDDAVVATVRGLQGGRARAGARDGEGGRVAAQGVDVAVTTADRGLAARVEALGARTLGPRLVRN